MDSVSIEVLRKGNRRSPESIRGPDETPEIDSEEQQRPLLCRQCRLEITSRDLAIEVDGRHQHTFFNPAGILFEIGCFGDAPGCAVFGEATTYFAWFPGYAWRFALCRGCKEHLGWTFESSQSMGFYGLILNKLVEGD
jgi:hypothetical protein